MKPRRPFAMYPTGSGDPNRWWVYVLGTRDGGVKVGTSTAPRHRMEMHRQTIGVTWSHLFSPVDSRWVEGYCKKALQKVAKQRGRTEVFDAITREEAIRICREVLEAYRIRSRESAKQAAIYAKQASEQAKLWAEFRRWRKQQAASAVAADAPATGPGALDEQAAA